MKICIATGIYPPQVGGVATYAHELRKAYLANPEATVRVVTYGSFLRLMPTGVRHIFFSLKLWWCFFSFKPHMVIALGTFHVGSPVRWARMFVFSNVYTVLRIGGDAAWEMYTLRTKSQTTLPGFYKDLPRKNLSLREHMLIYFVKKELQSFDTVVFSSDWLRAIYQDYYQQNLANSNVVTIENCFSPMKIHPQTPEEKKILYAGRNIPLKNLQRLDQSLMLAKKRVPDLVFEHVYDKSNEEVIKMIRKAYAVIVPSLSDVSPNFALEALSLGVPVLITKHNGLTRFKKLMLEFDPFDVEEMALKIVEMCSEEQHDSFKKRVESFEYRQTWNDIGDQYMNLI